MNEVYQLNHISLAQSVVQDGNFVSKESPLGTGTAHSLQKVDL